MKRLLKQITAAIKQFCRLLLRYSDQAAHCSDTQIIGCTDTRLKLLRYSAVLYICSDTRLKQGSHKKKIQSFPSLNWIYPLRLKILYIFVQKSWRTQIIQARAKYIMIRNFNTTKNFVQQWMTKGKKCLNKKKVTENVFAVNFFLAGN